MLRTPYFCSGCPHNSSTRVPEGSIAKAGIGCHYMAQWMDRRTMGYTQMGGEGANWVGEAPFSRRGHVFQNIGDGTYYHSGLLAVRAAIASGVNITFKILYNDAVAMTGGQRVDGPLSVPQITREVWAEGARPGRGGHRRAGQISAPTRASRPASRSARAPSSTPCSASCARSRAPPCWSTTRPARPRSAAAASAARWSIRPGGW